MPLHVYSARMGYRGPAWLDVTRMGNVGRMDRAVERGVPVAQATAEAWGLAFAPSTALLHQFLAKRRAGGVGARAWRDYRVAFTEEMRNSYRESRDRWDRLLAMPSVVLLCFCTDPNECHRALLRAAILPKLGAIDCGELAHGALPEVADGL